MTCAVKQTSTKINNRDMFEEFKIQLIKIRSLMPYDVVADEHKIDLLNHIHACLDSQTVESAKEASHSGFENPNGSQRTECWQR